MKNNSFVNLKILNIMGCIYLFFVFVVKVWLFMLVLFFIVLLLLFVIKIVKCRKNK